MRTVLSSALVCTVAAMAQEAATPARRATILRVVDRGGQPVAGAEVTCTGVVAHAEPWSQAGDVVKAVTDARGHAKASLLPGLGYHAWALGPADAEGRRSSSTPNAWFGAGGLVEVLVDVELAPTEIAVTGLEPWREFAPTLAVSVVLPGCTRIPLALAADGKAKVPPLPPAQQWLEVLTAGGELLWRQPLVAGPVRVPPPLRVPIRAEDAQGQPLAGVTVRLRAPKTTFAVFDVLSVPPLVGWRTIGVTDAAGRLEGVVPADSDPFAGGETDLLFEFALPGHERVLSGAFASGWFVADRQHERAGADTIVGVLRKAEPIRGKVSAALPSGTRVELRATAKLVTGESGYILDPRSYVTGIGDDGTFEFLDVPEFLHDSRLVLLPPPGAPTTAAADLPLLAATPERMVPDVIDVAGATRLRLRVRDTGDGPAIGVTGYLHAVGEDARVVNLGGTRFFVDPGGTAELTVTPGRWSVFVGNENGHAALVVDTVPGVQEIDLRMTAATPWRIRVRDGEGRAVVGAALKIISTSYPFTKEPDLVAAQLGRVAWLRHYLLRARSDAAGLLTVPFDEGVTVTVCVQHGERQSGRCKMAGAAREVEVVLP